jgi:quercetin dioxygenase-like cupin family protein
MRTPKKEESAMKSLNGIQAVVTVFSEPAPARSPGRSPATTGRLTKKVASAFAMGWIAFCGIAPFASAEHTHTAILPNDVKWGPAPAVLPPGAQAAVLFGDPSKEGVFVLRLKFPAGYRVAPHTHPVDEIVTVISGTFHEGMGETFDRRKAQAWPAGTFFVRPPGMAHYVFMEEETVIQISTNGPWGLTYINPKDDPQKAQ